VKLRVALALGLGLAVLAAVLWRFDMAQVGTALEHAGLGGFAVIVLAGLCLEAVLSLGLIPFLPRHTPFIIVVWTRQLRDSTGDVLPITQLGGMAFAVRALVLWGLGGARACAAVIADATTEVFAQGLFVLLGASISLSLLQSNAALSPYVGVMLGGAAFLSVGAMGFALVQVIGTRHLSSALARFSFGMFPASISGITGFHAAISALYGSPVKVAASIILQWLGWMASGVWLWVMLWAMDVPASLWTAIAIQALLEGLRSVTVFIPAAIGVQEAGYAILAQVFGLTPEIGVAVALLRRARDIVVAVPVFLIWQALEVRHSGR
jgi:putative membrane protein